MEQDNLSISWKNLPWNKFRKKFFRLQCKIYEAKQNNNYKSIHRLQKLLLKSKSTHYLAVREITESYSSKNFFLLDEEKLDITNEISKQLDTWKYVFIKLPTCSKTSEHNFNLFIKNEVIQYIWKLAIEPLYFSNCLLEEKNVCYPNKCKTVLNKKILKFGIEPYFDKSKYNFLMTKLVLPSKYKKAIYTSLKRGLFSQLTYAKNNSDHNLANFLIHTLLKEFHENFQTLDITESRYISGQQFLSDNFTIFYSLKERENPSRSILNVRSFLRMRGLSVNLNKISIFDPQDGFDFFEFYFRKEKNKSFSVYPNKVYWRFYREELSTVLKRNDLNLDLKIKKLQHLYFKCISLYKIYFGSLIRVKIHFMKSYLLNFIKKFTSLNKKIISKRLNFNC
jgi:hypothetical protein